MSNTDPVTGHADDVEANVVARSVTDPQFRQRLLADPKAALAGVGLQIPDEISIHVLQEDASNYYLVLPSVELTSQNISESMSDAVLATAVDDTYTKYDSQNSEWTGCASGQSGCVATNGCTVLLMLMQGAASGKTAEALANSATHMDH